MRRWPWLLVGLVLMIIPAQGAPTAHLEQGPCGGGGVGMQGLWIDEQRIYAGRLDGYVVAVDRSSGRVEWTYPQHYVPDAPVRSIVGDGQRIYIAPADAKNDLVEPIIALDARTGQEVWRQAYAGPGDTFRLAQDGFFLYAGQDLGTIVKIRKDTGQVAWADGPIMFTPTFDPSSPDPHGIYAITVHNGIVYAAHNWGYAQEDREVNRTQGNNTIIILYADDLRPASPTPAATPGQHKLRRPGGAVIDDAIFAMWADEETDTMYMAGTGLRQVQNARPQLRTTATFYRAPLATDGMQVSHMRDAGPMSLDIETSFNQDGRVNGVILDATGVHGDSTGVYFSTAANEAGRHGYLLKLNKADLSPAAGFDLRTRLEHGAVNNLMVDPGAAGEVVAVHDCLPGGPAGGRGLLAVLPKAVRPFVSIQEPVLGEPVGGTVQVSLLTAVPGYSGPLTARLFVSPVDGRCDDGHSCYQELETGWTSFPANVFSEMPPVPLDRPEGGEYRLKVIVTDSLGRTGQDIAERPFAIDRTPPQGLSVAPVDGAILNKRDPVLSVAYREEGGIAANSVRLSVNGMFATEGITFNENGFHVALGGGNPALREGFNFLRVEVRDRAGNSASMAWTLRLDSSVATPIFEPGKVPFGCTAGQPLWVRDTRPVLKAQFLEQVTLTSVLLDQQDATSLVTVGPAQLGTEVLLRPIHDVPVSRDQRWSITARDGAGNVGGPFEVCIRADATPPAIEPVSPVPGRLLTEDVPTIRFSMADGGSGLRANTMTVFLDGVDVTRDVVLDRDEATLRPKQPLKGGPHTVTVSVFDVAGNQGTREWTFSIDLDSPVVQMEAQLPPGQTAVKRGDQVTLRFSVSDGSAIRSVRVDARGLDASLSSAAAPQAVAGQPGTYQMSVQVTDERTRTVRLSALAEDVAGRIGFNSVDILVDNDPPVTVATPLPAHVERTFVLEWRNTPRDESTGGSGVAYYFVEVQTAPGAPWSMVAPHVNGTSIQLTHEGSEGTLLRYRVHAVDRAGNVQTTPSNVVETRYRGDPFERVTVQDRIIQGIASPYSAVVVQQVPLENSRVTMLLSGGNDSLELPLERFGRLYRTQWNGSGLDPGIYLLRFRFSDFSGVSSDSQVYVVQLLDADEAARQGLLAAGNKAPALQPLLVGVAFAAWAAVRRRRA